jgi:Prokaryotic Cytochrome C oxidase subunit IV
LNTYTIVTIWLYLVVGTVAEVGIFYARPGSSLVEAAIVLIAAANALITAAFSMGLKDESKAIQYFMLAPVALLSILILTMLFAFPQLS